MYLGDANNPILTYAAGNKDYYIPRDGHLSLDLVAPANGYSICCIKDRAHQLPHYPTIRQHKAANAKLKLEL